MQFDALAALATVDHNDYWFAGILTVVASLIVVIVMLVTSRTEDDDPT